MLDGRNVDSNELRREEETVSVVVEREGDESFELPSSKKM